MVQAASRWGSKQDRSTLNNRWFIHYFNIDISGSQSSFLSYHQTIPAEKKVPVDATDFAVDHPETYVGILIGRYNDNTEYVIEVTEIGAEDMDY